MTPGIGVSEVEQLGECADHRLGKGLRCGCSITAGPARHRDAQPFDSERARLGGTVNRVVQHSGQVVEQVFHASVETLQYRHAALERFGRRAASSSFPTP